MCNDGQCLSSGSEMSGHQMSHVKNGSDPHDSKGEKFHSLGHESPPGFRDKSQTSKSEKKKKKRLKIRYRDEI